MSKVVLSLGSNMGNRIEHLRSAVESFMKEPQFAVELVSNIYETQAVGGPEQDNFLNLVLLGNTRLDPFQMLAMCQILEEKAERVRTIRWGPRTLDVDILAFDHEVIHHTDLLVPHPRAHERAFVLVPWNDIDPNYDIPGRGKVAELRGMIDDTGVNFHLDSNDFLAPVVAS